VKVDTAFLFTVAYILFFLVGGFTGMWLSHVGLNISMHDTFYVVAHFHLMLAGVTLTGIFAGVYFYFFQLFGLHYNRMFSYAHLVYYAGGVWLTFLPLFFLGFSGLPRRVHDFPAIFLGWQGMATCGQFITIIGVTFFLLTLGLSHLEARHVIDSSLGFVTWQKRAHYYLFKIKWNQQNDDTAALLPLAEERVVLREQTFSEYEVFRFY
jgi:heme/copper-type cytochrome/quinol oxidase subunit 1